MSNPCPANLLPLVAKLEARARAASNVKELGFSIANDTFALLQFRQAFVYPEDQAHGITMSGLVNPPEDSPYLVWLQRTWHWLKPQLALEPTWFAPEQADLPEIIAQGWQEWWPAGIYVLPLRRRDGELLGWSCFLLDAPPPIASTAALAQLADSWGYCWEMLSGPKRQGWFGNWQRAGKARRYGVLLCLLLLPFLPVRQSVLAPAEVISLDSTVIASPLDGVIKSVNVRPNQTVQAGEVLFVLDDTTLRNQLAVAQKAVEVADLELMAVRARILGDQRSQESISLLTGKAKERRAELEAIREQLSRVTVLAPQDGVVVFGDPDDWLGRPVNTGERIMLLANPTQPGILIHLAIADAINLPPDAPVTLFLTVDPLSPLRAQLIESGYQALLSPQGISSYRLRAKFNEDENAPRIGLQGTAKLNGETVTLGYYLLRRPFSALREWSGW